MTPFQSMLNDHLDRISTARRRFDIESHMIWPTQLASYTAGSIASDFERSESENMLTVNIIVRAQSECASPAVFATNKEGTVRFIVGNRKSNGVTICDLCQLRRMDVCIEPIGDIE